MGRLAGGTGARGASEQPEPLCSATGEGRRLLPSEERDSALPGRASAQRRRLRAPLAARAGCSVRPPSRPCPVLQPARR